MSGLVEVPKEGERVLAATRRPDGTMRKPVRIRAGYTPQDEVSLYQSKATLFKQGMPLVPPGYDPEDAAAKPKTKAAKKNEKRKEKKHQTGSSTFSTTSDGNPPAASARTEARTGDTVSGVVEQMKSLTVSQSVEAIPRDDTTSTKVELDKRIRALRKKIRLVESLQASSSSNAVLTPEQAQKLSKLDTWRQELVNMESQVGNALQ